MTPRELEICARVHIVRKEIAKSKQPELAREMGITQNQLAGIEYGRTPLRYGNARFLFTKAFSISFNWLPDDLQLIYSEALISAHKSFAKKYSAQLATLQPPAARKFLGQTFEVRKNGLTDAETSEKLGAVNHPFKKLLADLRQATSAPGEMSALAKYLGEKTGANVPLASVSRWLSGKREPGGEITLWMREWVTDSKRQK